MGGYQYRGTGTSMSDDEVAARLKGARATAAARVNGPPPANSRSGLSDAATTRPSALAASREARAIGGEAPPPTLKGAVKVGAFPSKERYPFRAIADDGGVWKLDPAVFPPWKGKSVKAESIRTAASKWATERGLSAKTEIDGGYLFLQFTRRVVSAGGAR